MEWPEGNKTTGTVTCSCGTRFLGRASRKSSRPFLSVRREINAAGEPEGFYRRLPGASRAVPPGDDNPTANQAKGFKPVLVPPMERNGSLQARALPLGLTSIPHHVGLA